jgi:hypothetical protein
MNNMNPNAVNLWITGSAIGYLVDGGTGAVWGLAITSGLSLLISLLGR